MLFNLLLAHITVLLSFFVLFLVFINISFTITVEIENTGLKLTLVIPIVAPITVAKDAIEVLPVVTVVC